MLLLDYTPEQILALYRRHQINPTHLHIQPMSRLVGCCALGIIIHDIKPLLRPPESYSAALAGRGVEAAHPMSYAVGYDDSLSGHRDRSTLPELLNHELVSGAGLKYYKRGYEVGAYMRAHGRYIADNT